MIVYRKKFVRLVESWNGEEPSNSGVDLVRCFQQLRPLAGMFCREFYTIVLDLSSDQEALLGKAKPGTRYEIRRAATKDRLVYDFWDGMDRGTFEQFCDYHDQFAVERSRPQLDRLWLSLLAEAGFLNISRVTDVSGETLVWHCYHRTRNRATLLYSASLFRRNPGSAYRNRVGRANRFHHWQDMLRFKQEGVSVYDFGGWYQGETDQERLRINKFKEGFGGEVLKTYICERGVTWKGTLFLRVRQMLLGNAI